MVENLKSQYVAVFLKIIPHFVSLTKSKQDCLLLLIVIYMYQEQ